MKEKIIQFMKTRKHLIAIAALVICLGVVAFISVGLLLQPDSEEKTPSKKRQPIDRVVMGPKTQVLFYQDFDNPDRPATEGGSFAGGDSEQNIIENITEGDNSYLKMSYNKNEYCAYAATTTGVSLSDGVIVEISLSTDGGPIPDMVMCYPYDRSTTSANPRRNLFVIRQDGSVVVESATIEGAETTVATLEKGKWVRLAVKFTPGNGQYTVFVYNETSAKWEEKASNTNIASVISPSYMRFQILTKEANVGTSILFDDFAVYTGNAFIDLSKVEMPIPIKVTTGPDVEMDHPEMVDIGSDGVVVMDGKDFAYVGEEKITLSQTSEKTTVGEESGLKAFWHSIVNFFRKLFGMTVKETVTEEDILVSGDFLQKYLDIKVKDTSKTYAIGELAKEAGKNVVYDDRGLIVVTNSGIKLDAEEDVKLLTMLYGLFETGEVVSNYAAAPIFDQEAIDHAIDTYAAKFPEPFVGTTATNKSLNALYYLTLISRFYPDAKHSTKDVTVVDAALKKLHAFIDGGGEPFASAGCWFGHGIMSSCFVLIKNTDAIYSKLTEEDMARMDTIMAALAIAGNWQYNDANDYTTSFDLQGNLHDNANYRNTYLTIVLNAALYFGPEKLNEIYTNFDYDTYMAKFEEYGFTNIYNKWIDIGYNNAKELMEQGGDAYLIGQNGDYYASTVGSYAGTGKGVKLPFSYKGLGAEDVTEIFAEYLIAYTYAWKTISEFGTPDTISHCYILSDNKTSPLEGQMGMMLEFATIDSGDIRSKASYCYDSFMNLIPFYANMKLLYNWDSSTQRMRELDNRIWVGNEDMIYKLIEGYQGRAISVNYEEYEYEWVSSGHEFLKDIWYNFHSMQHTDITITENPEKVDLTEIAKAEPKEGDGINAPEDAWEAIVKNGDNTINAKSFYRFLGEGEAYESGKVAFDFVIPDGIDENDYNVVVMLDQQDKNRKYTDFNILFRLMSGWIDVYNGAASVSDYIPTGLRFGPNYRFHVEWEWDVAKTSSQIKITQTWPETKKEVSYTSKKLKFRATGDSIQGINSLVLVKNDVGSPFWVEDFKLVEAGKIVKIVESEPDLVRVPGAYYQNDFNNKNRKISYNANSSAKGNNFSLDWDEESKNGWLDLKIASENNGYFRPKITGAKAKETLVVEMKLSTDGTVPDGMVIFPYKETLEEEKTTNFTILSIRDGGVVSCGGETVCKIKKGSWTQIGMIYTPSTGDYAVYEYNQKTGTYVRKVAGATDASVIAPTYMNVHVQNAQPIGSNLLLDNIRIYGGNEFYFDKQIDNTGVVLKRLNKFKTPDGYYYYGDYNMEDIDVKYDAQTKSAGGYTYSQGFDANGNGYMSINSIPGTTTSDFFRARVEGATNGDYIITELDLRAGADGTPKISFMYDYDKVDGATKVNSLFTIAEGTGKVTSANSVISSARATKWSRIGVIVNQKTGDYTLYRYNESKKTYEWMAAGKGTPTKEGYPTFVGFSISAPNSTTVTRSIHVDNFFVYGSNTAKFKNAATGTEPKFDGTYYSQDYSDEDLWDLGFVTYGGGGYNFTRKVDADGNAYVRMASKPDSNAYDYFRVNLNDLDKDPNRSIVVEFALRAGKNGSPYFSFQFEPEAGKTKTLFNVEKGEFQILGSSTLLSTLSSDSWTRIGMILNLDTGEYTLYEYDKASNTYMWREEGKRQLADGYPTWIRFSLAEREEASNESLDLDDYKIYSGTAFANAITGEKVKGDYYANDYNVAKFLTAGATTKSSSGYDFTQGVEADGNGYLKVTSKAGENLNSYFRANVTGVSEEDSIVVEMKLRAGESGVPAFGFYFNRTTAAHTAFSVADSGNAYFGDKMIAPITKDSWTQIGFILNRTTGEYTIYRNVAGLYVAVATGSTTFTSGNPTYFGFNITEPGEGNAREFHVDDFMVYGGTRFRSSEIADDTNSGNIEVKTVTENGVLNITSANTSDELFNLVLNDEEKIYVLAGQNAVLVLNAASVAADSNDRMVVDQALAGRILASMFNLNLTKQIGEGAITEVTSPDGKLSFKVTLPSGLKSTDENITRVFDVVRVNRDVVEKVESTYDATEGTITFKASEFGTFAVMYSDYFYYGDYSVAEDILLDTKAASGYDFTQGVDTDGNGYLKIASKTNVQGTFYADITGASRKMFVVEMKLRAGESGMPSMTFLYDRTPTAGKNAFTIDEKGAYMSEDNIAPIGTGSWTRIGLLVGTDGTVTMYRYVNDTYMEIGTYQSGFGGGYPTYIGFRINAPGSGVTREFHVDDFKVYEGTTFRDTEIVDLSNAGKVQVNSVIDEGAPNIVNKSETYVLATPLLNGDEKADVLTGKDAIFTLHIGNVADGSNDRTVITNALAGRTLGPVFTMNLTKKIGEGAATEVTSSNEELSFAVTVPDELKSTDENITRVYDIVRVNGDKTEKIAGTFNAAEGTVTFHTKEFGTFGIMYSDYFYYGDYSVVEDVTLDTNSASGYDFTQGVDTDGNGYLKITSKTNVQGTFYADITGASGKAFVVEMELRAGESGMPTMQFYCDRTATAMRNIFTIDAKGAYMYEEHIAPIKTDGWTRIGLLMGTDGTATLYQYVDGSYVELDTYKTGFGGGYPTYIGFRINAPGSGVTREFHVDDFKVYEGTTFRGSEIATSQASVSLITNVAWLSKWNLLEKMKYIFG